MIRDIVRYGDPRLLSENLEANPLAPDFATLLSDMIDTCHAAPGIGLAAPQIGINVRVAIVDLSVGQDPAGILVLANPEIVEASGEQKEEEGCLSVPDVSERVIRPARVLVRAANAAGEVREVEGTGLLARALCHEIDHLNRCLFLDRLKGLKRELTWKKVERARRKAAW
ncbi:MAG TPA: peptide deformylase [Thermoanaerobaculia bacterium]|nr:peptide deformylase [Thermoanaerobaculia bacterium]